MYESVYAALSSVQDQQLVLPAGNLRREVSWGLVDGVGCTMQPWRVELHLSEVAHAHPARTQCSEADLSARLIHRKGFGLPSGRDGRWLEGSVSNGARQRGGLPSKERDAG